MEKLSALIALSILPVALIISNALAANGGHLQVRGGHLRVHNDSNHYINVKFFCCAGGGGCFVDKSFRHVAPGQVVGHQYPFRFMRTAVQIDSNLNECSPSYGSRVRCTDPESDELKDTYCCAELNQVQLKSKKWSDYHYTKNFS